jgi:hypothetical protein
MRLTIWWPRKPQPPITRTLPKGVLVVVGIGAIVLERVEEKCWRYC